MGRKRVWSLLQIRRLLEEKEGNAATSETRQKLEGSCEVLVQLAEPGDAFSAFTASMNASAITGHIKVIEQRLGFRVGTAPEGSSTCSLKAQEYLRCWEKLSLVGARAPWCRRFRMPSCCDTSLVAVQEGSLTPRDASSILTLTGWTAALGVVALIVVAIGGGIWGYRRYHGLDGVKGYIRVVKGKAPEGA